MSPAVSQESADEHYNGPPSAGDLPELRAFAAENGAEQYLPKVVAFVRRLFPQAAMHIHVEGDPELAYNWQIVFEVSADGMEAEEQFQLHRQWTRELFQACSSTHVHLFGLSLRHSG